MRVTGRTAYIARSRGSWHAADLRTNGMVLSSFAMLEDAGGDGILANVDKLANYVAHGGGSLGNVAALHAAFGIMDYDVASGNSKAEVEFSVLAGIKPLFSSKLSSSDSTSKAFHTTWNVLPSPQPPLLFEAVGVGQVSAALSLNFVPETVLS